MIWLLILLLIPQVAILYSTKQPFRIFAAVFLGSQIYFGFLGPLYWTFIEDGIFLGMDWKDEIFKGAVYIQCAGLIVLVSLFTFSRIWRVRTPLREDLKNDVETLPDRRRRLLILLFLGLAVFAMTFVLANLGTIASIGTRGGFFLIAYQLADLSVPVALILVSIKRWRKYGIYLAIAYISFALLCGFRYKILLMTGPFILAWLFQPGNLKKKVAAGFLFPLLLLLFSFLTNAREKFSGFNIDINLIDSKSLLYGLFAESNIVFGLIGLLESFVENDHLIYFEPLWQSFQELVPRFLFPNKRVGGYVEDVLAGLDSPAALTSGTAYPYFGEYLISFGIAGMAIGCILYALFIFLMLRSTWKKSSSGSQQLLFCGLISIYFGYFYFSRGFLPGAIKIGIIVIVPIFLLLRSSAKRRTSL